MLAVEQIHFSPGDIFNKQIFNPITTLQFVAVVCFEASPEELPLFIEAIFPFPLMVYYWKVLSAVN